MAKRRTRKPVACMDESPLVFERALGLNNIEYLSVLQKEGAIQKEGEISFGGSQWWYYTLDKKCREYPLYKFGCGLIAFTDLLLFLSEYHGHQTEYTSVLNKEIVMQQNSYMDFARRINDDYRCIIRHLGTSGYAMAKKFNNYANNYNIHLKASWSVPSKVLLKTITELLSKNIPTIISISPNLNITANYSLNLYSKKVTEHGEHVFIRAARLEDGKNIFLSTNSHYLTVIQVLYYTDGTVMLEVSSWGKKYYINYHEYKKYMSKQPWFINNKMNNILYICDGNVRRSYDT